MVSGETTRVAPVVPADCPPSLKDPLAPIRHLYPFPSHYFDLDGLRMHYLDEGGGPVLLLLHGNPTWSFYYRNLVLELRNSYRVIVPDHIGCGLSDKPENYPYRLERHISSVKRLADHLGLADITLGVHDWGGAIGFGFAAALPERVKRLVIFNTAAFPGPVPWRILLCRTPILGAWMVRGLNAFARMAVWMACKDRTRMTPEVQAGYLLPYDTYAHRVAIHRFVEDIPTHPDHPTFALIQSIEAALPLFRDRPTAIFWGERDFCFHSWFLDRWIQLFPNARVQRYPAAGHYVVEDAHQEIVPALRDFLLRTDAGR